MATQVTLNSGSVDSAGSLLLRTNGTTTAITVDTSQNVGVGVTPSAWSAGKALEIKSAGTGIWNNTVDETYYCNNAYYNSGWKYGANGYAEQYIQYNGTHIWKTAASGTAGNAITFTQAMTLDASGNLCLGTTSPISSNLFSASSAASNVAIFNSTVSTSGGGGIRIAYNGTTELWMGYYGFVAATGTQVSDAGIGSRDSLLLDAGTTAIKLSVGGSEKSRIDSSGNLLVGTTSNPSSYRGIFQSSSAGALFAITTSSDAQFAMAVQNTYTTGNNSFVVFGTEASFTTRGSITYNRGAGLTVYNTTSDYRAKTVNGPVQNALSKLATLKPSTGRMNGAEYDIDFFVAHELQEVVPSAVTGEKDAVNEDGTPNLQMVDKSALIPLLTAAIQELNAKFEEYKAAHP